MDESDGLAPVPKYMTAGALREALAGIPDKELVFVDTSTFVPVIPTLRYVCPVGTVEMEKVTFATPDNSDRTENALLLRGTASHWCGVTMQAVDMGFLASNHANAVAAAESVGGLVIPLSRLVDTTPPLVIARFTEPGSFYERSFVCGRAVAEERGFEILSDDPEEVAAFPPPDYGVRNERMLSRGELLSVALAETLDPFGAANQPSDAAP